MDPKFSRSFIGYRQKDVSDRIQQVLLDFQMEMELRQAQEKDTADSNEEMRLDIKRLQAEIQRYRQREQVVSSALAKAQAEALSIEQEAQIKAEEIRRDATEKISRERVQLQELKSLLSRFKSTFDQLLAGYEVELAPKGAFDVSPEVPPKTGTDRVH